MNTPFAGGGFSGALCWVAFTLIELLALIAIRSDFGGALAADPGQGRN